MTTERFFYLSAKAQKTNAKTFAFARPDAAQSSFFCKFPHA
ncbi:hypothetical protein STRDD11_00614 [Streptococcus sp. DD11]|nr:hypothetical protein STRDD11_00614 [Streptococcus sp. DD11]